MGASLSSRIRIILKTSRLMLGLRSGVFIAKVSNAYKAF